MRTNLGFDEEPTRVMASRLEVEGGHRLAEDERVDFVLFVLGRDFEVVKPPPPPVRGWRIGPGRRPVWHERQSWAYRLAAAS